MALFEFHFHVCDSGKLDELVSLVTKGFATMRQDIIDFAAKVDAATTVIANEIAALAAASSGLAPDEKTKLQSIVDRLTALAADPNNPVPPV